MTPAQTVILVQPLGVRDQIFPWGIHLIGDYLEEKLRNVVVKRLLLQRDAGCARLFARYSRVLGELFALLTFDAQQPFDTGAESSDLGIYAVWLGDALVDRLRDRGCLVANGYDAASHLKTDLTALHVEFLQLLDARLDECGAGATPDRTLWGISVYDRTLFFGASLARRLKKRSPSTHVVLGGDYFTFANAGTLMRSCEFVDGTVVGYGEETLRQIVASLQHGHDIRQLAIRGLVNARGLQAADPPPPVFPDKEWLTAAAADQSTIQIVNVPPTYRPASRVAIRYVRRDEATSTDAMRVVRVMFQRGCSYGKCTFCTQIDKKLYFRLNHEDILASLAREIADVHRAFPDAIVKVSFDADEHAPRALADILEFLESDAIGDEVPIVASLWFQAKFMNPRIARSIAAFRRSNVQLVFIMNFETLNPATLALMDKGHSPLTAIFGAKVIQDAGQHFETNYMEYFPGEAEANVGDESTFLHRSLHLLAGKTTVFPYSINGRDDIFQNQARFGVRAKRFVKDLWIQDVFDLDLESSFWNYSFDLLEADDVTRAWHSYVVNRNGATRQRFHDVAASSGAAAYLRRATDLEWLRTLHLGSLFAPAPISLRIVSDSPAGGSLHKDYRALPGEAGDQKPLSAEELAFLRFLYQPRPWSEVVAAFKDTVAPRQLDAFKSAHHAFGSIVEHDGLMLCTANDSAWNTEWMSA